MIFPPRDDGSARPDDSSPLLIGLTGPIGCGKSTVARMLAEIGGRAIDADELAHDVTAPGSPALPEIRDRFGDDLFDAHGALDRAALAAIVFSDPAALLDLERIVHPRVRELVEARLEEASRARVPFIVIEAIKLIEGGLAERCDEIWIIDCDAEVQRERLAARGASADDIERRVGAQGRDLGDRLIAQLPGGMIARVITTDGPLEQTADAVEDALAEALDRPVA